MATRCTYGPPDSDSDESYDGFVFSDPLQPKKREVYVAPDQRLYDSLFTGDVAAVAEEMKSLRFHINARFRGGHTLLMHACREGHYELAEFLIKECSASVTMDVDSVTALMLACDSHRLDGELVEKIVRLLLEHGAKINEADQYGRTPFIFACRGGFIGAVRLLIDQADKNAVDNFGYTALFHAIEKNRQDIVKLLVESGVNLTIVNSNGYTPAQVAEFHGFNDLLEWLPQRKETYLVPSNYLSYTSLSDIVPRIFLKTDCPEYFQDINSILSTINMEQQLEHFAKAKTSLAEFLTMDASKLKDVGILLPIYHTKILKVILDFHLHHWTCKSIARVRKNGTDNFYEILLLAANHLQHLVIIQSSLRFVLQNLLKDRLGELTDVDIIKLESSLKAYRSIVKDLTRTTEYLGSFSPKQNPLYIDYPEILAERKRKKVRNYFKYTIILGISVYICFKCKWLL
ncbi:ankyrin repeat, SAM and basic leucine zipper domain-containing protein 1 [Drosophila tropicalis]|uniref:ankyrin repeat, SAM and basic leucine zipper domain-containing protein 1 n=1 Tax=Drosophila tropicalis TaxID=46794 RepID=UPI0035ABF6C4